MQHMSIPSHGAHRDLEVGAIALDELDAVKGREVGPLSRGEVVQHAHVTAAPHEGLDQV
jgi:hypothetical protein